MSAGVKRWCINTSSSNNSRARPKKKLTIKILGILFILFWLYILGSWIFAQTVAGMTTIDYLTPAQFHQGQSVQAWIFKKEYLLYARSDGTVSFSVNEGARVYPQQALGTVTFLNGTSKTLQIASSGIFSAQIDNLENTLQDYNRLNSLTQKPAAENNGEQKAFGKVIDNLSPVQIYLEIQGAENNLTAWKVDDPVKLVWRGTETKTKDRLAEFLPGEEILNGKVIWLNALENKTGLLVEVKNCPDQLILERQVPLFLTLADLDGYLVPKAALVSQDKGIYYLSRGRARLQTVEILASLDDDYLIASPALDSKVRYVSNARWVKEGERLE